MARAADVRVGFAEAAQGDHNCSGWPRPRRLAPGRAQRTALSGLLVRYLAAHPSGNQGGAGLDGDRGRLRGDVRRAAQQTAHDNCDSARWYRLTAYKAATDEYGPSDRYAKRERLELTAQHRAGVVEAQPALHHRGIDAPEVGGVDRLSPASSARQTPAPRQVAFTGLPARNTLAVPWSVLRLVFSGTPATELREDHHRHVVGAGDPPCRA